MTNSKGRRARLGMLLALALGALALVALPGFAAAKAKGHHQMRDRNHDHIPDRWEKRHKLSLKVNQAHRDQDHDSLDNLGEYKAGDNPHNPDSNGNGVLDGEEHAGKIVSYDPESGKLTIGLFGGESVSGLVTEETEIECGCSHGEEASEAGEEEGTVSFRADSFGPGEEEGGSSEQGDDESGDQPGQGQPDHSSEHHHSRSCSSEDLVVGAAVKEAELQTENGVSTFSKVELGKSEG